MAHDPLTRDGLRRPVRRRPRLALPLGLAAAGVWLRYVVAEPELERRTRARLRLASAKAERAA